MSRFSKLETGQNPAPDDSSPNVGAALKRIQKEADPEIQYDFGHYQAQGDQLYFRGEFPKALRVYSRAIQQDATQVQPWVMQVLCLLEQKQYKEALVWVKRGIELFPEDARLLSVEGVIYAHEGMVQRGLAASDYALKKSAADPMVWILRGEILCLADNANWQSCFEKAMERRDKDDWQTPMQIGLFFMRLKKWSQAAEFLKKAAQIASNNDYIWMQLGKTYERLGLTQAALEAYNASADIAPRNTAAQGAVGRLTNTPVLVRLFRKLFH
jgi:tetratricopeptide (TPR) repeat protein